MNKELILIADLTHISTGSYATNLIPYPIASIKSYLLHNSKFSKDYLVDIYKSPDKFIDSYIKNKPCSA